MVLGLLEGLEGLFLILFVGFEDLERVHVQFVPTLLSESLQVLGLLSDLVEQPLASAINVAACGVSIRSKHVLRALDLFIVLKVPDALVGSQRHHELALAVFDLTLLNNVDGLLHRSGLVGHDLRLGLGLVHAESIALREQVLFNRELDVLLSEISSLERLQDDEVLHVLKHLNVDAADAFSTRKPDVVDLVKALVVVLPDPGSLQTQLVRSKGLHLHHRWQCLWLSERSA